MKEALYYKKIRNNVQCMLCPRNCSIKESQVGFCGVRKNISSKLYSLVYAKPVSVGIDPIEENDTMAFFLLGLFQQKQTLFTGLRKACFCWNRPNRKKAIVSFSSWN